MVALAETGWKASYEDFLYNITILSLICQGSLYKSAAEASVWCNHVQFFISPTNLEQHKAIGTITGPSPIVGRESQTACKKIHQFVYHAFNSKMHSARLSKDIFEFRQKIGIKVGKYNNKYATYQVIGTNIMDSATFQKATTNEAGPITFNYRGIKSCYEPFPQGDSEEAKMVTHLRNTIHKQTFWRTATVKGAVIGLNPLAAETILTDNAAIEPPRMMRITP